MEVTWQALKMTARHESCPSCTGPPEHASVVDYEVVTSVLAVRYGDCIASFANGDHDSQSVRSPMSFGCSMTPA